MNLNNSNNTIFAKTNIVIFLILFIILLLLLFLYFRTQNNKKDISILNAPNTDSDTNTLIELQNKILEIDLLKNEINSIKKDLKNINTNDNDNLNTDLEKIKQDIEENKTNLANVEIGINNNSDRISNKAKKSFVNQIDNRLKQIEDLNKGTLSANSIGRIDEVERKMDLFDSHHTQFYYDDTIDRDTFLNKFNLTISEYNKLKKYNNFIDDLKTDLSSLTTRVTNNETSLNNLVEC